MDTINMYNKSTNETDFSCYGSEEEKESGHYYTGWYISLPKSIRETIAKLLGLKYIYCIGHNKKDNRVFIQLSQRVDPRNGSLEYVEVKKEFVDNIIKILTTKPTEEQIKETIAEWDHQLELARHGLL